MNGYRRAISWASALLLFTSTATTVSAKAEEDVLDRREFLKEISLDVKNVPIDSVLRAIALSTEVPFILDFERDTELRVTFSARNMAARALLVSLAGGYGLAFSESAEGVVVRRPDSPPAATKRTDGAWPPGRSNLYRLEMVVRDGTGTTISKPVLTVRPRSLGEIAQGVPGGAATSGEALTFDRRTGDIVPEFVGGLRLALSVNRETDTGLTINTEFTVSRRTGPASQTREITVAAVEAGPGETIISRTSSGIEFVLVRWTKLAASDAIKP